MLEEVSVIPAPPIEDFTAITCPIEQARDLTVLADKMRHRFPVSHAALRRAALRQARHLINPATGRLYTLADLGSAVGLHPNRIWQLIIPRSGPTARVTRPVAVAGQESS